MTSYLVTRRLAQTSPLHVSTYSVGRVELRSAKLDTPSEHEAIAQSQAAYGEGPDGAVAMRASVIVQAGDERSAQAAAETLLDEALDLVTAQSSTRGLNSYSLLDSGCIRNLDTGRVVSIRSSPESQLFNAFHMPRSDFPTRDLAQLVLTVRSDLGDRYIRAAHWSRKAEVEPNPHIATLFEWFAAETVWTITRNDDIIPLVLWTWGFSNGQGAKLLDAGTQSLLSGMVNYRHRRQQAQSLLESLRTLRNSIVHNGFRRLDVSETDLSVHASVARMAGRGALGAAQEALAIGLTTAAEAAEYLPIAMEPHLVQTAENLVRILKEAGAPIT